MSIKQGGITGSALLGENFSEELVLGLPDAEQEITAVMLRALSDHVEPALSAGHL